MKGLTSDNIQIPDEVTNRMSIAILVVTESFYSISAIE
jgi:hypothetical protein